jgi:hypothetical protein
VTRPAISTTSAAATRSNAHRVQQLSGKLLWQISDKFSLRYFGLQMTRGVATTSILSCVGRVDSGHRRRRDGIQHDGEQHHVERRSGFIELSIQGADLEKSQDSVYWRYWLGPPPPLNTKALHTPMTPRPTKSVTSATGSKWDWLVGVYVGSADQLYRRPG